MSHRLLRGVRGLACASFVAITVIACGGGGGGGGSSSSSGGGNGLRFTPNQTTVNFDYTDTQQPPFDSVIITATGNLPDTFYIMAQDQSGHLDPEIRAFLGDTTGTFEFKPRANLAPGSYSGTLRLMACSNQSCTRQIGNSPVNINYTIRVRAGLKVTPQNATSPIVYTSGQQGSVSYTVQLPEGSTAYSVQKSNPGEPCEIVDVAATTFRVVSVNVPSGNYQCVIRVDAGSAFDLKIVSFQALPPAGGDRGVDVQESGVTLTSAEGAPSAVTRLHVTPATWDSRYDVEVLGYGGGFADWLQFTPATDGYDVVADARDLPEGTYSALVRVFTPPPYGSFDDFSVSVTVGPGLVRPADVVRAIDSESVVGDLSGSVPINLAAGPQVTWIAETQADWLTVSNTGQTGGNLSFDFNNQAFRDLPNGREHVATIVVNTPNPAISAMSFDVRVNKRLAQVTGLGPYLHTAGRPIRAYVRGVGFSSIANISRIQMSGVPVGERTFTPVNDTTVILEVPDGLDARGYTISATNALNFPVQARTLVVENPVAYAYAAMPTNLPVGNINYDAERKRVYITSSPNYPQTNQFVNWQYDNGTWTPNVYPQDAPMDLGFSPDGSQVYAVRPGYFPWQGVYGNVYVYDANSLTQVNENPYEGWVRVSVMTGRQIPVSNDGRIFLGADGGNSFLRDTTVFDSINREYSVLRLPGDLRFDNVTYEVPRDGSKVFVGEVRSPEFSVGRYDATTSSYVTLPGYQAGIYNMHSSDDGSRVVQAGSYVFNSDMEILQNIYRELMEFQDRIIGATVVSPDGRRAYALAFDTNEINRPNPIPDPPQSRPRIYVLDLTSNVPTPDDAAVLGYFEIDDYPICRTQMGCDYQVRGAITPDGGTLFYAGQDNFVVVPVPPEGTLVSKLPPRVFKWQPGKKAQ